MRAAHVVLVVLFAAKVECQEWHSSRVFVNEATGRLEYAVDAAGNRASGMYVCRLAAGTFVESEKIMIVR